MSETLLEDVLFDTETVGLAESFADLDEAIAVTIVSDEEPEPGETIFFGFPLPTEDIAEVRAEVVAVEQSDEDEYRIQVKIQAADAALKALAVKALTGGMESAATEAGGPIWAFGLKQRNGAYAVVVNAAGGVLTAAQLRKIAEVAEAGAGIVKLTHAQRVILLVNAEQLDGLKEDLATVELRVGVLHHGIRNIRACAGGLCRWAVDLDGLGLSGAIDERLFGRATNFDIKIAISDCKRNCAESYCADLGLIGGAGVYTLVVGGRGSQVPFRALNLVDGVKPDEAGPLLERILDWYEAHGQEKERFWKTLQRIGTPAAEALDLGCVERAEADLGDGVDELARIRAHYARLAGLKQLRGDLGL